MLQTICLKIHRTVWYLKLCGDNVWRIKLYTPVNLVNQLIRDSKIDLSSMFNVHWKFTPSVLCCCYFLDLALNFFLSCCCESTTHSPFYISNILLRITSTISTQHLNLEICLCFLKILLRGKIPEICSLLFLNTSGLF